MTSYSSQRTEIRRADSIQAGDHIIDPNDGRSILNVFFVEPMSDTSIWLDAMKRRRVARKVWASQQIAVCIPLVRA